MGWWTLTGPSTDMEPQGAGKQVLQHPGPQVVILLSEQEMVEIWRWSHVRTKMTLCTVAEDEKERLEGEWTCDVRNSAGSQWSHSQHLD